ncbi:PREDICTED: ATR-interacting protein [Elephantulus edwardii]|uniref:ATR-interacting protein n=1 Tax=Elephantulus edwardii TaxID=28737 RepID=UPI0003F09B62|nr:PREDICTED: ATR-interacting protein [Elephantulus edwardii]
MAGTHAPDSSRRRSGPPMPRPGPPLGAGCPPTKKARIFPDAPDPEDPFGAHGDFTADDLEELDILASQALSHCPAPNAPSVPNFCRIDGLSKNKTPAAKSRGSMSVNDNFESEILQAQYNELKEKMKAMEEEILIKKGEIKILRDSLHQTESTLEEQRRTHFLLEQEKAQALSDKEKEFSKKLQSLQSELQFKDAEMNELRTKLQSSERTNKLIAPAISHCSPRKSPSVIIKPETSSPQFGKTSFPTKESFSANMCLPFPGQTEPGYKSLVGRKENKIHSLEGESIKQEEAQKILVDNWMQRSHTEGSILISLLLRQPLVPGSSLGLCHLLSSGSEAPTGTLLQAPGFGSTLAGISALRTTSFREGSFSLSALREAQSLALTGLHLIARSDGSYDQDLAKRDRRTLPLSQLSGAVHLLPLVQFFIGLHCQALQDYAAAKRSGAPGDAPAHAPCMNSGVEASPEDSLCNLEAFSMASLSVLQDLVCHSGAVVCLLLSGSGADTASREMNESLVQRHGHRDVSAAPKEIAIDQAQHPLLKILLRLLTLTSVPTSHLRTSILSQCLTVLVKLAENASFDFLPRFQNVLRVLPQCLSPETPLNSVLLTIKLLSLLVDDERLASQLCCHSEGCLFLLLYMSITSKPDKAASERQWLQLEQEVVWLLAKVGVQYPSSPVIASDCQCNVEVMRALTVMLHRQWLTVRRAEWPSWTDQQKHTVRCLRDIVLLLYGLSQKDKLFTVHCVEVLHQYDQVMPAVSALIRGLPDVTQCEEAALYELCAAENEVDDLEMDCP